MGPKLSPGPLSITNITRLVWRDKSSLCIRNKWSGFVMSRYFLYSRWSRLCFDTIELRIMGD